jgi:hypothetical protein
MKQKLKPENRAAKNREVLAVKYESEADRKKREIAAKGKFFRGARVR